MNDEENEENEEFVEPADPSLISEEEAAMNLSLVKHQNAIRSEVAEWAERQSSPLDAAYARRDFEDAVLEALRNGLWWQHNTNSDLCSALGNSTLFHRVSEMQS